MSGHVGGQTRALPFTGLTSGPIAILGLALTIIGTLMTMVRSKQPEA